MAENIAKLLDYKQELIQQIRQLQEKQKIIENRINKVSQPYKNILYMIYFQGMTLVDVASGLEYNYEHTCRMHGTALKKYEEVNKSH